MVKVHRGYILINKINIMKKVFILIALFFSISAFSQLPSASTFVDSGLVKIPITLKAEQMLLIFDCLDQNTPQYLNFASQLSKNVDTVYNPNQQITVLSESGFIRDVYIIMGVQQERFTSGINDEIKAALFPQISNYSWLMRELQGIVQYNSGLRQQRINRALDKIKQMK
jgi:hypothetical protein